MQAEFDFSNTIRRIVFGDLASLKSCNVQFAQIYIITSMTPSIIDAGYVTA